MREKRYLEAAIKPRATKLAPESMIFSAGVEQINDTNYRFEKLKLAEITCLALSMSGFACAVILAEVSNSSKHIQDYYLNFLIASGTLTTVVLLYAIYWRAQKELKWQKAKLIYSNEDDLGSTKKIRGVVLELLLNAIHPAYGLHKLSIQTYIKTLDVTINYNLPALISVFMLLRIYHLIRLFSSISKYRTSRGQRLCKIYGIYPSNWFALKCMMKVKPVSVITSMFVLGLFTSSYAIWILERPMYEYGGKDFTKFGNAIWYIIVTMATVGYGDYYPATVFGRITGFLACIWGIVIVSITTLTFSNLLSMNLGEETSLLILERLIFKDKLRDEAAWVLTSAVKYQQLMKRDKWPSRRLTDQFRKFRYHLQKFQAIKSNQKTLYDFDCYTDRIEMKLLGIIDVYEQALMYNAKTQEIIEFFQRQGLSPSNPI